MSQPKIVVITGASSGIGDATARLSDMVLRLAGLFRAIGGLWEVDFGIPRYAGDVY